MDIEKIGRIIAKARKEAGMTQEQLAAEIGVTTQAVSKWENGHNLPDLENLLLIAEITNIPYAKILVGDEEEIPSSKLSFRDKLFQEDNMFTRVKTIAQMKKLKETYQALHYMKERHQGQYRKKNRYSNELIAYINHPLLMACHAYALGIDDDAILTSILLHDVVEDTGVRLEDLPFSDEIKELVGLVTFSVPEGMQKKEAKNAYYEKIKQNGKACVIKVIDRCNNVSTMAGSFTREKLFEYIEETENYIFPVLDVLKHDYPEYSNLAFLIKYQLLGLIETMKYLIVD